MNVLVRLTRRPSRLAVCWFVSVALVLLLAGLASRLLVRHVHPGEAGFLAGAFAVSSVLLVAVSAALAIADRSAAREKQNSLQPALAGSLAAAILFLAVQGLALTELLRRMTPEDTTGSPRTVVFVAVALHALHGIAALLWLVYVTLRGFAGDYDHEYRFGLTACGWCWHALGVVWIAILFTFATAR